MIAFVAWTPLHLINIINTKVNYFPEVKSDLYIYGEFSSSFEMYEKIKKEELFTHVFYIDLEKNGNKISKIVNLIFNKNIFIEYTAMYEKIFIQGENYFSKILYGQSKKKNPDLELNYIEDGLGAYVGSDILNLKNKKNKLINFLNPYSIFKSKLTNLYVYEPDLVETKYQADYYPLDKLTKMNDATRIIQDVFSLEDTKERFPGKILFLDQPLEDDGFAIDEQPLFSQLIELVGKENFWIKLHPRSNKNKYGGFKIIETSLPWELYFLNYDFTQTMIISAVSTAAFTPKLMMNINSSIILLPKFIQHQQIKATEDERTHMMLDNIIRFSEEFNSLNSNSIYLPKTTKELKSLVQSY